MKSTEFLKEDIIDTLERKYNFSTGYIKFLLKIQANCQPYFNEVGFDTAMTGLYRGMHISEPYILKSTRLKNREPLGMDPDTKNDVNDYFSDNFGAPFRDAVFCTGDKIIADNFGHPFVIFPKGNFKYFWSPDVFDLNTTISRFYFNSEGQVNPQVIPELIPGIITSYTTQDLDSAIKSKNEIMIRCNKYYAIRADKVMSDIYGIKEVFDNSKAIRKII